MITAAVGFGAGVATAAVFLQETKKKQQPSKATHPVEWAIWSRIDRNKVGYVTRKDIMNLCYRFSCDEWAEHLAGVVDPDARDHVTFTDFITTFKAFQTMRRSARLKLWHRTCGIGVAGNVAGHMAQAGEASKDAAPQTKPAALFTYYMPQESFQVSEVHGASKRLEQFPVTYAVIHYPNLPSACKVQVEPELALYVDIVYTRDKKKVDHLMPRRVAAFNDCSIRSLDGADKLSMKKNWGFGSKGISVRCFEIDSFSKGSFVDQLAIVSYLKRGHEVEQYSIHAPCRNYMLFNEPLLEWIVEQINEQQDTDKWEEIFPSLKDAGYPTSCWIACGAGEYTPYGAAHFLEPSDEVVIVVYDETILPKGPSMDQVNDMFDDKPSPAGTVVLHQTFV
eukprot:TRINITY_DN15257_c0_g1_i1.p1 TRINITY_DN15257_c0_g1~~TRINITY_DN15257_c0_g1_i1.p1  ORF type:complete len:412 (-),score=90.68 TRINITY_DN15257_c0_g1_i1:80-1258(-)